MMRTFTNVDYLTLRPMWDEVVIEVEKAEEKTKGGILVPETSRTENQHAIVVGKVVSMGPMAFQYNMDGTTTKFDIVIGDFVVFRPYAGDLHEKKEHDNAAFSHRLMNSRSIVGRLPRTGE